MTRQENHAKGDSPASKRDEPAMDASPTLLTTKEVAKRLRLDETCKQPERVVRRMVQRGELVGFRVSQRYLRVTADSLDSYLRGK